MKMPAISREIPKNRNAIPVCPKASGYQKACNALQPSGIVAPNGGFSSIINTLCRLQSGE
jgi:hypothetical protein